MQARSLAEEFGISERTIRRDLQKRLSGLLIARESAGWLLDLTATYDERTSVSFEVLSTFAKSVGHHFYATVKRQFRLYTLPYTDTIASISQIEEVLG